MTPKEVQGDQQTEYDLGQMRKMMLKSWSWDEGQGIMKDVL